MALFDKSFLSGSNPLGAIPSQSPRHYGGPQIPTDSGTGFSNIGSVLGGDAGPSFNDIASGKELKKVINNIAIGESRDPPAALPHKDSGKGEIVTLNFQPNILDNYDAVTYHFKLFMTSTEVSREGLYLDPPNQIIIAESGVSDLTIDRIELHALTVPSIEAGTGTSTELKFEIVEPAGAGLLDKMFYESVKLGIGNWFVMPCYLQLTFKARDPETSEAGAEGQPGAIGGVSWVWPIKLSKAKANVTTVGTRYEFDAIIYNELAQGNAYFNMQHNVTLNNLKTFGDAMADLELKLNQDQWLKLLNNYSKADTYRIVVDPLLAEVPLIPSDDNQNSWRGGDFDILSDKTATVSSGTSVDKIVDTLLANTKRYQASMAGSLDQTAGKNPGTLNQQPVDKMKKFWRVTTETIPIAFDYKRQNTAVEIIIFVFEYDLGVNPASPTTTGGTDGTTAASKQLLDEYIRKKILRKKYNYIFTGLNDQIINFDLNMNFAFAAALTRFAGIYYDGASSDFGPVIQKNAEDEAAATEKVRKVISLQNNASDTKNAAELPKLKKEASDAVAALSGVTDERKKELITMMNTSKPIDRLALTTKASQLRGGISEAIAGKIPSGNSLAGAGRGFVNPQLVNGAVIPGSESATSLIDRSLNAARQEATAIASPPNSNLKFISDLNTKDPAVIQAYEEFKATSKGKLRPIPFHETAQESSTGQNKTPNSDSGKNKLASLFSTALYSTIDASLLHVKMTIKGDPYWLFPQPVAGSQPVKYLSRMTVPESMEILKASQIKRPNTVNLFGTDNFIILRFRTPRVYNETTNPNGTDPFTEVEAFTGVYRVIQIVSRFEMGKFTQELTCLLDPVIDTQDLIKRVEDAIKLPDVKTSAADLLKKAVPSTAINTSKLPNGALTSIKDVAAKADALKNQVNGVADTARSLSGKVHDFGVSSIGNVTGSVLSNIPAPNSFELMSKAQSYFPNTPPKFGP